MGPAARLVLGAGRRGLAQAAAAMLQGMTAHYLGHGTLDLSAGAGHVAVVLAAAGGVGQLLVQIARGCGRDRDRRGLDRGEGRVPRAAGAHEVTSTREGDLKRTPAA